MAGDVDEADVAEVGEAEVDGDAAAFFFFESIGVDSGEGSYQRSLTVIDVSGGAYDERNGGLLLLQVIWHCACPRANAILSKSWWMK
jgi:hypothetical protein